jgi:hypothetical protein
MFLLALETRPLADPSSYRHYLPLETYNYSILSLVASRSRQITISPHGDSSSNNKNPRRCLFLCRISHHCWSMIVRTSIISIGGKVWVSSNFTTVAHDLVLVASSTDCSRLITTVLASSTDFMMPSDLASHRSVLQYGVAGAPLICLIFRTRPKVPIKVLVSLLGSVNIESLWIVSGFGYLKEPFCFTHIPRKR